MLRRFSIRTKLAVSVVLLVGITGFMIAGFVLWNDYRAEEEKLQNDSFAMAMMLQHALLDPLRLEDDFHIYEQLSAPFIYEGDLKQTPSRRPLEHIVLLDEQGSVLASSDPLHFPLLIPYTQTEPEFARELPALVSMPQGKAPLMINHDETSYIYLMAPIGENGIKYATLVMAFSKQIIFESYVKKSLRSLGFISLISISLMFLAFSLSRRLSAPLLKLSSEIRALGGGRDGLAGDPSENADEIVLLEQTFHAFELGLLEAERQRDASLQRERLALAALDHSTQGMVITTPDADIEYVNNAYARATGYSADELLGENPRILKSDKTPQETYQSMWTALNAGHGWQGELINRRKDGTEYSALINISVIRDETGHVTHLLSMLEDITERKEMELQLKDSEARFRSLFDYSPDAVWLMDRHRFIECNKAAVELFGMTIRDDFLNLHPSEISPAQQPDGESSFDKAERMIVYAEDHGITRFEWLHRRSDFTTFDAEVTLSSITLNQKQVLYAVVRDISHRKRIAAELQVSQERLRAIVTATPSCIKLLDAAGNLVEMNRRGLDLIEADNLDQVQGQCVYPIIKPEHREAFKQFNEQVCAGHSGSLEFEVEGLLGTPRWLHTSAVPMHDPATGQTLHLAVTYDVTKRRRADEDLRQSEQNYREIFNSVNDAVFIHDAKTGVIVDVNDTMVKIYGYSDKKEVINLHPNDIGYGESPYGFHEAAEWMRKALTEGPQVFDWYAHTIVAN